MASSPVRDRRETMPAAKRKARELEEDQEPK